MANIEEQEKKPEMSAASEWTEAGLPGEKGLEEKNESVSAELGAEKAPSEQVVQGEKGESTEEKPAQALAEKAASENIAEKIEGKMEKKPAGEPEGLEKDEEKPLPGGAAVPTAVGEIPAAAPKSEVQLKIESLLMEDLEDIYNSLSEYQQRQFKAKQEETASKIEQLIRAVRVKIREVVKLIGEFLKVVPGLNKFFLEQEAKIKTDKILGLTERDKRD